MRAEWQADDPDAFAAQEERRSSWRRAKRGGVVACGVVAGSGELPGAFVPRALVVRAINDDPLYRAKVVWRLSALVVAA